MIGAASPFLGVALEYAELGWPAFPLIPRNKKPVIPSAHAKNDPLHSVCKGECGREGHGLHDATCDLATIERWWRETPNANVGLRTGVAFDVLDVDGTAGQAALMAVMPDEPMPLGYGPWSATPGKNDDDGNHLGSGDHLLYLPTGIKNKVGFVEHIDWRGSGGYIVAPPSIHPHRTGTYQWVFGPEHALEPAPSWLVALVQPPAPQPRPGHSPIGAATGGTYGQKALEGELGRLVMAGVGQRNHALNASAFALAQLVAGGALDAGTVVAALLQAAERIGLAEHEARNTITSGMRAGLANPRRQSA